MPPKQIGKRRVSLVKSVREARAEHKNGQVKSGTVDNLLEDFSECGK
jgi:hypothetical protein